MNTMSTSIRSNRPRSLIAAAALTALISGFSAVSNTADAADLPKTIVKYADLDISSSHGAATLYSRIRVASEGLCSPFDRGDVVAKYLWKQCVKQAIEGAVTKVNQPALFAVYAAKFGVLQQPTILTADRR